LRGLHPDVFSGSEKGICFVFNMNRLFEAFASLAIAHAISNRDLRPTSKARKRHWRAMSQEGKRSG
jgi:hypothetical protein